jgi:hypothetical protein
VDSSIAQRILTEFTAAGLFGIFTRFHFKCLFRMEKYNAKNGYKGTIKFYNMQILFALFAFVTFALFLQR